MILAIIGATGLVGTEILKVIKERGFHFDALILAASPRSVGKKIDFEGQSYTVQSMEAAVQAKPDIAIFSAGGNTSLAWAPKFAEVGTTVIDNSSAWRMDRSKKLIVPEVNADLLKPDDRIIANPNCSTIQLVVALAPLHRIYKIRRLVISTYQSFTGTGQKAVDQYNAERLGKILPEDQMAYDYPIFANCIPHCDVFLENDYTKEEMKLVLETRKILSDPTMRITATAVRVPVFGGHSEAVNVEFEDDYEMEDIRTLLAQAPGLTVVDNPARKEYPMPLVAHQKDDVFVGRLRRDNSHPNALNMWIVADNLRKGAATNALQIAEWLVEHDYVQ